jgi:hypothetical protein
MDVPAVDRDRAALGLIEVFQQREQGRLAGP